MTRLELQTEVLNNLLELDKVKKERGSTLDTRILQWLNWAQNYLADLHTYEEMRKTYTSSTIADQRSYGFPARMKDIYSLVLRDGASSCKLLYASPRTFDKQLPRPLTSGTGRPSYYVDYGVNFELFKVPDAVYDTVLRCSLYPADLASDSSTSDLLRKDALLCAIATMFGFRMLREGKESAFWNKNTVLPLYQASLMSDHSAEDWVPVARGFGQTQPTNVSGEWWNSPFTGRGV